MVGWAKYGMMWRASWQLRLAHTQAHYLSVSGKCSTSIFSIQPDGKIPYFSVHLIENPPKALATPRLPKSDSPPLYSQSSRPYTGSHFLLLPICTALHCTSGHKIWESMEGLDQRGRLPPSTTQSNSSSTLCLMHTLLFIPFFNLFFHIVLYVSQHSCKM